MKISYFDQQKNKKLDSYYTKEEPEEGEKDGRQNNDRVRKE